MKYPKFIGKFHVRNCSFKNILKMLTNRNIKGAFGYKYGGDEMEDIENIKKKKFEELMKRIKERELKAKYPSKPIYSDADNFYDIINRYEFVIVDFYADWCYPCHMLSPIIEDLAKEYAGKVVFVKVNVDENQPLALKYNIMGVPTLVFLKNGREIDRVVGYAPKDYLKMKIERYIY